MNKSANYSRKLLLLLAVLGLVLFYRLGSWGVTETSEARYAEISWEMFRSGDYLHPRLLGIGHYHKPPLTYWITTVSYHLFGVSAWAARFFLQVAVLLQVGLVFRIGQLLFENQPTAFRAAVIYASFPGVIVACRGLTTDAYLATFVLLFVWAWLAFKRSGRRYLVLVAYLALGLGFLTKGPVVFIVPVAVAWAINRLTKGAKAPGWLHALGSGLMLLIGLSWFVALYGENRQFLDYFVLDHTVRRLATNQFGRSKPFWYYLVLVPVLAFPWFLIILPLLFKKIKQTLWWQHLFFFWVIVPLIFFSVSRSKLVLYVLPIFPGIALAAAWQWSQLKPEVHRKWLIAFIMFVSLAILALIIGPQVDSTLRYTPLMYGLVGLIGVGLFITTKIGPTLEGRLPWATFVFTMLLVVFATHFMAQNPALVRDQRPLAQYLQEQYLSDTPILVYNERLPSLAFHLQRDIISLYDGNRNLVRETQFESDQRWRQSLINLREDPLPEPYRSGAVVVTKSKNQLPVGFENYRLDTTQADWSVYVSP